jgi:hypothetical protein
MAKQKVERRQPPKQSTAPAHWGGAERPEELDRTPVEMPLGYKEPMTLQEQIARAVQQQLAELPDNEPETWEESNDFEPDEPEEILDFTRYTLSEVPEEPISQEPDPPSPKGPDDAPAAPEKVQDEPTNPEAATGRSEG